MKRAGAGAARRPDHPSRPDHLSELRLDGSHGEGGGQILRSSVTLAAITGRAVRITNIRAGRPKPGLAAQHIVAARAMAAICHGSLAGDTLGSQDLRFTPGGPVVAGDYFFDVAEAREGGSAGAATLILQSVLPALALADGRSTVAIRGGTHMAWAPPYDYIQQVWLPILSQIGFKAAAELRAWGWYPVGRGEIFATIDGLGRGEVPPLQRLTLLDRGPLQAIVGRAVAAKLPPHVPTRMAESAQSMLADLGVPIEIEAKCVRAACSGAGIFLTARYAGLNCGFSALGARGKPSETVASEAVSALRSHHDTQAAVDRHLADQLLLPLSLACGRSRFSAAEVTRHLETNAWVIEKFGLAGVEIERGERGTGLVTVMA